MKRLVAVLIIMLAAVVVPSVASQAQTTDPTACAVGVFVEGRCLTVDGQSTLCVGDACVEFVEEVVSICPEGAINVEPDPLASLRCRLTEPASQYRTLCPDGSRGEVDNCFIYVAKGPDGCPTGSETDASNDCRRAVNNSVGGSFCEDDNASLQGIECISIVDPVPSPCPTGTTRMDQACWRLNGLVAPESCAGHQVVGTAELASGLCQVPVSIPTGPETCVQPATYHEFPAFRLVNEAREYQGDGPTQVGCVDESVSPPGGAVANCIYLDDELGWGNYGDPGVCTRFEQPVTVSCPDDFSFDDFVGGLCRRFEAPVNDQCLAGSVLERGYCFFGVEFAEFECPAETTRLDDQSVCVAYRPLQNAHLCAPDAALLGTGALGSIVPLVCRAISGPQPDQCNAQGTLEMCFEIRAPIAVDCGQATGCIAVNDFDGEVCGGLIVTIDMNLGASGIGTPDDDVILGTPGNDVVDALGGNDVVCAGDGDDSVVGGSGDDTLIGGNGRDIMRGNSGVDRLEGEAGNDRLLGGIDGDTLIGGDGDDYLGGFGGADTIIGGPGNETIFGGFGADTIDGGSGNDVISGLIGNDIINGGDGNDTLNGDRGQDTVNGGNGNDTINGGNGDDILNGDAGMDTVNGGRADDTLSGGAGTNDTCVGNKQNVADTADTTCETIFGVP